MGQPRRSDPEKREATLRIFQHLPCRLCPHGLVAGTEYGVTAAAVYLFVYTFMNLGVWAVVILLRREDIQGEDIESFRGLLAKQPAVAVLMLLFLMSLAGIPTAGWIHRQVFLCLER